MKNARMVDYSKWDKMSFDSDEDDDRSDQSSLANVTRLPQASRVTIGPDGASIYQPKEEDNSYNHSHTMNKKDDISPVRNIAQSDQRQVSHAAEKGTSIHQDSESNSFSTESDNRDIISEAVDTYDLSGKLETKASGSVPIDWTVNGGSTTSFYWTQTKTDVVLRIQLHSSIKSKDIQIRYDYNNDTDTNIRRHLLIYRGTTPSDTIVFEGYLQHDIAVEQTAEESRFIKSGKYYLEDWEVVTMDDQRFIELSLRKHTIAGTFIWWDRVLVNDPKIDLSKITGRINHSYDYANVWNEAHKLFRENISKRQMVDVDDKEKEASNTSDSA